MRGYTFLLLLLLLFACNTTTYTQPLNIKGYNWESMKKHHLEHELDEVSGIVYSPKEGGLIAVNDEQGRLYMVSTSSYKIKEDIKFAKSGDYEAVALHKNKLLVMNSKGSIWEMKLNAKAVSNVKEYDFSIKEKIEFEAMLWDGGDIVYLVSKQSNENRKHKKTLVYGFDMHTKKYIAQPIQEIKWSDISKRTGVEKLQVSAAAIHPKTGDIYMVASIEKLMVVLNKNWVVKEVHELDKKLFKQPEGIAFDLECNLYISNEARGGRPNVIYIPIKK